MCLVQCISQNNNVMIFYWFTHIISVLALSDLLESMKSSQIIKKKISAAKAIISQLTFSNIWTHFSPKFGPDNILM